MASFPLVHITPEAVDLVVELGLRVGIEYLVQVKRGANVHLEESESGEAATKDGRGQTLYRTGHIGTTRGIDAADRLIIEPSPNESTWAYAHDNQEAWLAVNPAGG